MVLGRRDSRFKLKDTVESDHFRNQPVDRQQHSLYLMVIGCRQPPRRRGSHIIGDGVVASKLFCLEC